MRGKLHELGVWTWILGNKDRLGVIDASYTTIADATGIDVEKVREVITLFCSPDPESRSQLMEGRRLVPLPDRGFGWRLVNHDLYRERARKQLYGEDRTASGQDAQRKAAARSTRQSSGSPDASRGVPRCPAKSRGVPLSDAETESETESEAETESDTDTSPNSDSSVGGISSRKARRAPAGWKRLPVDYRPSNELRAWAAAKAPGVDFDAELEAIRDCEFKNTHTDADATVRQWLRTEQKKLDARKRPMGAAAIAETKFQRAKRRLNEAAE